MLSRAGGRLWAALREDGRLVGLAAEEPAVTPRPGRISRGRVTRVLSGMQAAFVDLGDGATGLLPAASLRSPAGTDRPAPLEERVQPGRELLVQVRRAPRDGKVAELTTRFELVGRYLVLVPGQRLRAVSRRVREPAVRQRLATLLRGLAPPELGFLARAAAALAPAHLVRAEAERLRERWREITERSEAPGAPRVLWREPDLLTSAVRDAPSAEEGTEILVDDPDVRSAVLERLGDTAPDLSGRVRLVPPAGRLYEEEMAEVQAEIQHARVALPSGGAITVERTAALVSIDVDSGSEGGAGGRDALERANREAAREIPRQLRLRNLCGIVVVDWIPLPDRAATARVLEAFADELAHDPARIRIAGPSALGLFELTRECRTTFS